jgi:hypothetical protein
MSKASMFINTSLMANIFKGTPLETAMDQLASRPLNGSRAQPIDA